MHDNLVTLVDKMLKLNKRLATLSEFDAVPRATLEKEIEHTDKDIDTLVYKLYGLTAGEIRLIESRAS